MDNVFVDCQYDLILVKAEGYGVVVAHETLTLTEMVQIHISLFSNLP